MAEDPTLVDRIHEDLFAVSEQFPADEILPRIASPELTSPSLVAYYQTKGRFALRSGLQKR